MNSHPIAAVDWPHPIPQSARPFEAASRVDDPPLTTLGCAMAAVGRRWRPLSVWMVACLAIAVWYLDVTPPEFSASTAVILEPRRQVAGSASGSAGTLPSTLDSAQAESQIQVVKSERILASVFDILNLRHAQELAVYGPSLRERAMKALGLSRAEAVDLADEEADARIRAFQAFSDRVGVRRVGLSYILEVSYRAGSAAEAARIANAITSAYILAQVDQKAAAAHNGEEYLQNRISDIEAEQQAALDGIRQGRVPTNQFPDADARIIGAALRPLSKASPQITLVVAFALSFGALAGLLAVAVGHALDRTLKSRAQIRNVLGIECLGLVPDASRFRGLRGVRRGSALGRAVISAPSSRFAQAVRSARTAIVLPFEGHRGRAIGFVSCSHGEGSTTLASNVAHLMAVSGNPVELIDGDLRSPTLTAQLAPRSSAGLNNVLVDDGGAPQFDTIELSPSLNFLPAVGAGQDSEPNVYFGAPSMVDLLSRLTAARDVIIDLPPLRSSSDAQALCPHLDGVVLVIEANRTRIEDAMDALRILRAAKANVLGVVLNKAGKGDVDRCGER